MGRFILSETSDWHLVHDHQDIRGWPVHDASGTKLGTVHELIANTNSELVESVVLDTGREYPARDIDIGDDVVYVEGVATTGTDADPVVKKYDNTRIHRRDTDWGYEEHEPVFRQHYQTTYASAGEPYDVYAPGYRMGYIYGSHDTYRDRDYDALEPEMRRSYEVEHGEGTWDKVKDAVRHAFGHARR